MNCAVAGALCQIAVGFVKEKLRLDDTPGVFAVHGVGGIFGTIMAPVLATGTLDEGQGLVTQLIALAAVATFTLAMTAVFVKLTQLA